MYPACPELLALCSEVVTRMAVAGGGGAALCWPVGGGSGWDTALLSHHVLFQQGGGKTMDNVAQVAEEFAHETLSEMPHLL